MISLLSGYRIVGDALVAGAEAQCAGAPKSGYSVRVSTEPKIRFFPFFQFFALENRA
jgi:hypothetical protein